MSGSESETGEPICSVEEPTEPVRTPSSNLTLVKNNTLTSSARNTSEVEAPLSVDDVLETTLRPRSSETKVSSLRDKQGQDYQEAAEAMRVDHMKKPLNVYFMMWKDSDDLWRYRARYEDASTLIGNLEQAKHSLIDKNLYNG